MPGCAEGRTHSLLIPLHLVCMTQTASPATFGQPGLAKREHLIRMLEMDACHAMPLNQAMFSKTQAS